MSSTLRFFVLATLILSACSSRGPASDKDVADFQSVVLKGSYEEVWQASVRAMDVYTLRYASFEKGVLTTDWGDSSGNPAIFGDRVPASVPGLWGAHRYQMNLLLSGAGANEFRVEVRKGFEKYNPSSGIFVEMATDGLEEGALLKKVAWYLAHPEKKEALK